MITEGLAGFLSASSVPKSVSAETSTRSSLLVSSKIPTSVDACIPQVPDVHGLVPGSSELTSDNGRKSVVYQEPQEDEGSGISLSLTATAA